MVSRPSTSRAVMIPEALVIAFIGWTTVKLGGGAYLYMRYGTTSGRGCGEKPAVDEDDDAGGEGDGGGLGDGGGKTEKETTSDGRTSGGGEKTMGRTALADGGLAEK